MPSPPVAPGNLQGLRLARRIAGTLVLATLAACSSKDFYRETDTTGRFRVSATSCRFLIFFEAPFDPRLKAMELMRDTWMENISVTRTYSWPDWGFFTFLNGLIIGFRGTIVEGEYGVPPETPGAKALYEAARKKEDRIRNIDGSAITPTEGIKP